MGRRATHPIWFHTKSMVHWKYTDREKGSKMEFEIRFEDMLDGTMMATAHVEGEGGVFLGYFGKNEIVVDAEARAYVEKIIGERREAVQAEADEMGWASVEAFEALLGA